MPLTPQKARQANVTVVTQWEQVYQQTPVWNGAIAMRQPSATQSNLYAFMNAVGKMVRRGKGIVFRDVAAQAIEVVNDDWSDGIKIAANEIADDRLGIYLPTVGLLGARSAKWPDQQLALLLKNGELATSLCHDGQPFFSATHPIDTGGFVSGTWSNYDSGAGFALSATTYQAAWAKMATFPDQANEPMGIIPTYLVVPPALRLTALNILKAQYNAAGATNVLYGDAQVLVIPELAGADDTWYLLADLAGIRPIGWQDRESPMLLPKTSPLDDNMFFDKEMLWALDARGEFYYGPAYLAYKAKGS